MNFSIPDPFYPSAVLAAISSQFVPSCLLFAGVTIGLATLTGLVDKFADAVGRRRGRSRRSESSDEIPF